METEWTTEDARKLFEIQTMAAGDKRDYRIMQARTLDRVWGPNQEANQPIAA